MHRLGVAAGLVLLLAGTANAKQAGPPLLGIVGKQVLAQQLVRFDPATLRPLPGRLALGGHRQGWSFSPDGKQLVLGYANDSCVGGATNLRFVDVNRMRSLADVRLVTNGSVVATGWPDASHVVAVVAVSDCLTTKRTVAISIDATTHTVVGTTPLRGDVLRVAVARGELVALLAPRNGIGRARLAVVDGSGRVRETVLGGVRAGRKLPNGGADISVSDVDIPGLAVDAGTDTAYVVPAGDRVAAVDLRTLRVVYHELAARRLAKGENGPTRQAVWLGNGLLAVTGSDSVDRGRSLTVTPAGLRIVDTRNWTFRVLDRQVSDLQLAGGLLFATGGSYAWDGRTSTATNAGLIAYSLGGRERYRLFSGRAVGLVAAIGGRGFAATSRTVSFDLASGKPGRTYGAQLYELLLGDRATLGY